MARKPYYHQELLPTGRVSEEDLKFLKSLCEPGPMEPQAVERQPYDSLYVKLKKQRDYWNPNS